MYYTFPFLPSHVFSTFLPFCVPFEMLPGPVAFLAKCSLYQIEEEFKVLLRYLLWDSSMHRLLQIGSTLLLIVGTPIEP